MAATAELSTPPLMATAVRFAAWRCDFAVHRSQSLVIAPPRLAPCWRRKLRAGARLPREYLERESDIFFGGVRPRLKRTLARASAGDRPMAASTCDGSTAPEEQAAPAEHARPCKIERDHQASPSTPGNIMLEVLGVRGARAAVHARLRHAFEQAVFQAVAQRADARCVFGEALVRHFGGLAQSDDASDIFRAGAAIAFVVAAVEQWFELEPLRTKSAPTPLGP